MTPAGKKKLSEIDICDLFISPAIKAAGWDQLTQIRREVTLAPGPITGGNIASRNKKKKKFADYVLYQEPNVPIGVIERAGSTRPSSSLPSLTGFLEMWPAPGSEDTELGVFMEPEASHDFARVMPATRAVGVQEGEWPTKWAERGWGTRVWGRVTLMMDARVVLDFQCVAGHRA